MRWPTARGCAGALIAVVLVAAAMIFPEKLGELAPLPHIETFISLACGGPSPCPSPARDRRIAAIETMLGKKMPGLDERDRSKLATVIYEEARAASLDPFFILALIAVESGFDHVAESERGARGLMQLQPSTLRREAERLEVEDADLDDPVLNVRAGVRYLRRLLRAFGSTDVALMAYNAGPNRILKYLQDEGDIPDRFQIYPKRVQGELSRLKRRAPAVPPPAVPPSAPMALGDPARPPPLDGPALPGAEAAAPVQAR